MSSPLHGLQTVEDGIHIIQSLEYADATARTSASLAADDIGRVALQLDNNSFWVCINNSPLTWQQMASASVPVHASNHSDGGSDEITVENLATSGTIGQVLTSDGSGGLQMSDLVRGVLTWGASGVSNTTTTRYLTPSYRRGLALTSATQYRSPVSGTLKNMRVRHNITAGNGNNIVYTLRKNSTNTSLTVSLSSTSSDGSDLSNTVSVSAGDLLDIVVTKSSNVGTSPSEIIVVMELI